MSSAVSIGSARVVGPLPEGIRRIRRCPSHASDYVSRLIGSRVIFTVMLKNSAALRVLLVEDEPLLRWSIAETLAAHGHRVVEVADGAAARRALTGGLPAPDVVLLDYRLPDVHDLSLLAAVRRLSPSSAVVLMTAFGTPDMVERAYALGVRRVMQKPFDMDDIAGVIEQAYRGA